MGALFIGGWGVGGWFIIRITTCFCLHGNVSITKQVGGSGGFLHGLPPNKYLLCKLY